MPEDQITTTDDQADGQADTAAQSDTESSTTASTDWEAEARKWQALARKHEGRAKENATARSELDKVKKAAMTEQERAVAEAEARGRAAATSATAARLARAEFRAAASGRVDKDALDGFLEYVDLAKFIAEDGEPDAKAIDAAIKRLAGPPRSTNFDGGARTTASRPTDMSALIRQKAFGR